MPSYVVCACFDGEADASQSAPADMPALMDRAIRDLAPIECRQLHLEAGTCLLEVSEAAHADRLANEILRQARAPRLERAVRIGIAGGPGSSVHLSFTAQKLASLGQSGEIVIDESSFCALSPFEQDLYGAAEQRSGCAVRARFGSGLKRCFVVSPIGHGSSETRTRANQVFDLYLKRACAQNKFQPVRSDQEFNPKIHQSMMASISAAELVIGYLGRPPWNPNVMIEVGYRLAAGGPLVLLRDHHSDVVQDAELPFDLNDMQVLELPASRDATSTEAIRDTVNDIATAIAVAVRNMNTRWSSPYPVAVIDIDTRPGSSENIIKEVTEQAARLFGRGESVVGTQVNEVISDLGKLMPTGQFDAFGMEQHELLGHLVTPQLFQTADPTVHATVPMVFQNHPHRDYDRRAFLPVIVRHRRNDSEGKLSLTVLYLDVTSVTSVQPDGTFVCQLVTGNGPELIWDSYAFSYDRILTQLSFYNDAVERHVRALSKDGVSRVLDLGAGTGNVTVQLLRRGQRVTAVDRSHAMLEGLRQKVLGLDDPYVLILERSAEDLRPLRDAQFDAVTILLALFAMDRPQTALSEAIRVLKPGGTLVVTEPNARFSLKPLLEQAETELRNMGLFESLAADWERVQAVNQRIDPAASAKFTAEGIVKMLKARRFEDIREEESHLGLCTTVTARQRG